MEKFTLIEQLEGISRTPKPKVDTSKIKYQQYELEVDGTSQIVNIPLREAENFEQTILQLSEPLTRKKLKELLREFRGTRANS